MAQELENQMDILDLYNNTPSNTPTPFMNQEEIVSGEEGEEELIGQAGNDNLSSNEDLFKGTSLYTAPKDEEGYTTTSEDIGGVGEYLATAGKMGAYGLLRQGVVGGAEFVASTPIWATKLLSGTTRAIEEGARYVAGSLLTKNIENYISKELYGYNNRNVFDYVDILDTQTDIDTFFDEYVFSQLNSAIDISTDGKIDNFFAVKGEDGKIIEGDYKDFMDKVFSGIAVPKEKQNFLGRVLMTGGEFLVPLGAMRAAGRKVGQSSADILKDLEKHRSKMKEKSSSLMEISKSKNTSRNPTATAREKFLSKEINRAEEKIKALQFKQRHYTAGNASAEIGKRIGFDQKATIKDFLASEGNMAIGAATAMVSTEYILEGAGLEEYKPFALLSGLAGGVVGINPLFKTLTKASAFAVYAIKRVQEPQFDPITGINTGVADAYLKYKGYSKKAIESMTDQQKIDASVLDPKVDKMARQLGQALVDIRKNGPEGEKLFREIEVSIEATERLAARFNRNLAEDIEKGLIKGSDSNYIAESLPVLLDQVVHLSSLAKVRETLLNNVSVGGIVLNAKRLSVVNELDKMGKIIEKQNSMLQKSLKAVSSKIKKDAKNDGTTEFSPLGQYVDVLKRFNEGYNDVGSYYSQQIDSIRKIKEKDVHPFNNEKFNEDMDALLGEDTLTQNGLYNTAKKEGRLSENIDTDTRTNAAANVENFGIAQSTLIKKTFEDMKTKVDAAYDEVENYSMDVDFLFRNNDVLDELIEASPAIKVYDNDIRSITKNVDTLIRSAREQGLKAFRNENYIVGKEEEHYLELTKMSAKHDAASGRFPTVEAQQAEIEKLRNSFDLNDPMRSITSLEKDLIKKDIFIGGPNNTQLISASSKRADGVTETVSAIPLQLSFKDINGIRGRMMSRAFERKSNSSGTTQHYKRKEIEAFTVMLDNKIKAYEKELVEKGMDINSYSKLQEANKLYRETMGATFKQRMGEFLKEQTLGGTKFDVDSVSNDKLFQIFFESLDHADSARQFKVMFSNLKDEQGRSLYPQAKALLLKSLRRHIHRSSGRVEGLEKIDPLFTEAFLTGKKGINLFEDKSEEAIRNFDSWRRQEIESIENSAIGLPFKEQQYTATLDTVLKNLSEERKKILDNSLFNERNIPDNTDDFIKGVFEKERQFHAAKDDIQYYKQRAEDFSDSEFDQVAYQKFKRNKEFVDSDDFRERYLSEDFVTGDVYSKLGAPIKKGASQSKSPVDILLETFPEGSKDRQKIVLSLRGAFIENISRNAYSFSKKIRKVTDESVSTLDNTVDYAFELTKDVQLEKFAKIMADNDETIRKLWADDPDQLERIEDIFNLEIALKTDSVKATKLLNVGMKFKVSSFMSRVYSISRGVVSPKYVATEIAIAKAQADKGTFMLQLLTDPSTTSAVADAMRITAGELDATPARLAKIRKMAISLFFTELGEEYPVDIKSPSWLKERLQFIPNIIDGISAASKRKEVGISEKIEDSTRSPSITRPSLSSEEIRNLYDSN